jgi:hypothetical protein
VKKKKFKSGDICVYKDSCGYASEVSGLVEFLGYLNSGGVEVQLLNPNAGVSPNFRWYCHLKELTLYAKV